MDTTDGTTDDTTDDALATRAVDDLLATLDLEAIDRDLYRGANPDTWPGDRVFGGLVAAQALRAAIGTVEVAHAVHSFHSYFVRPGRLSLPILYSVERIRDGRSFTTRRVTAIQQGEAIFTMDASFHRQDEEGVDYQLPVAPGTPGPDSPAARSGGRFPEGMARPELFAAFDTRELGPTPPEADGTYRSTRRAWIRTTAPLPDDPAVHACVLTFVSDMAVILAVRPPDPAAPWAAFMGARLDHAVWFHRPVR
ncbi:MAG TPA: acyl-CoA thioesterase domain-containing protein, partial [Acidimicrobiales bacterium]|nr:acyl-CoA thioesterase domain-containing protein [Acidimicrobiales bacterium]